MHTVIDDLSFAIERENRITVFAPSGSGKTTLINILNGFDSDFSGSYYLKAANPATVFQEPRLFSHLTVRENIFLPLTIRQVPTTNCVLERYERWLDICDLKEQAHHFPFQLSGGMKQKVSLVRSFITEPDFIMLDEPFKSIDFNSKRRIIEHIIRQYPAITILLATHDLEEIPLLTKWLLIFKTGVLNGFSKALNIDNLRFSDLFSKMGPKS